MLERSDADQIKNDYLEILESILRSIKDRAKSQGLNADGNVSIMFGRSSVFRGTSAYEYEKRTITPEQVEILSKAISDPKSFKGSLQIRIGGDVVYHAKDGEVLKDKLGLSPAQEQSQEQSQDVFDSLSQGIDEQQQRLQTLEKYVQEVESVKQPVLQENEVQSLRTELSTLKEAFENQQTEIKRLQEGLAKVATRDTPSVKNSVFQKWIANVESKVKQVALKTWDKVKDLVVPEKQWNERISNLESKLNDLQSQVSELKDTLAQKGINTLEKVSEKSISSQYVEETVATALHLWGTRGENGSARLTSDNYEFLQEGEQISVKSLDGRRTIMKNGQLTDQVNDKDLENFQQLNRAINSYIKSPTQSQAQSQSQGRGR